MEKPIDKKYLAGLTFRTADTHKVKEDGETRVRHQAVERELTQAEVLDWADHGASVVIVAADGRKHQVAKK